MTGQPDGADEVSPAVRAAAEQARARAATLPATEALARLLAEATAHPGDLTEGQIRALGETAIEQSRKVSALLSQLTALLGDGGEPDGQPG